MLVEACAEYFAKFSATTGSSDANVVRTDRSLTLEVALQDLVAYLTNKDDSGWRRIVRGKRAEGRPQSSNDKGPVFSRWCSAQGVVRTRKALARIDRLFSAATNIVKVVEKILDMRAQLPTFPPQGTLVVTLRPAATIDPASSFTTFKPLVDAVIPGKVQSLIDQGMVVIPGPPGIAEEEAVRFAVPRGRRVQQALFATLGELSSFCALR